MLGIAVAMLLVMIPMLSGAPTDLGLPVGAAGIVATIAAMWYAGARLTDKADGGPRLAFWGSAIRTMSTINIIVGAVLIVVALYT